jgi:hypothetical protein
VRSSRSHFVKVGGLRWLSVMLLALIAWAHRVWALPVLTALAPSERHDRQCGQRHKTLTDHGRHLLHQVARWLPNRDLVMVASLQCARQWGMKDWQERMRGAGRRGVLGPTDGDG